MARRFLRVFSYWPTVSAKLVNAIFLVILLVDKSNGILKGLEEVHTSDDVIGNYSASITSNPKEPVCNKGDNVTVQYVSSGQINECVTLSMTSTPRTITTLEPPLKFCEWNWSVGSREVVLQSYHQGIVIVEIKADKEGVIYTEDAFLELSVRLYPSLDKISVVIGWIYTIAWDFSFLPQILHNRNRQSVIGLSFDFLTLNFIGFLYYGLFNVGLYFIPAIQDEYYMRHPTSVLHVRLNDVIFPIYALICTTIQIGQCFIYERGNQRVSTTCRAIAGGLIGVAIVYIILVAVVENILWLDLLNALSYMKLGITFIKYLPQLYENYKRKSTEGWSIWQVVLDLTGGSFSLLQMFLLAYNYDDMSSVLTDPSKLGLGLLSVFFNIFFLIQHHILYRNKEIVLSPEEMPIRKSTSATTVTSVVCTDANDK